MIEIFDNRVVISNPGGLPKGLEFKNFGKVSMARNPVIASLLQRNDYIEKMGTGIQKMRNAMEVADLPEPEFDMDGFFIVTLLRESAMNVGKNVGKNVLLPEIQKEIIDILIDNPRLSASAMAERLGYNSRTVERNITKLKELGILKRFGSKSNGYWEVLKEGLDDYTDEETKSELRKKTRISIA